MGPGRVAALRVTVVAFLCVAAVLTPLTASADIDDGQVVFCLSARHLSDLRAAAIALGIQVPADDGQLANWRIGHEADFDRACAALFSAEGPVVVDDSQDNWFDRALPFLTGLAGAIFSYAVAALQNRSGRGAAIGDSLRLALIDFNRAAIVYASKNTLDNSAELNMTASRTRLVEQLALVRAERYRWETVETLYQTLTDGNLGTAQLTINWKENTPEARDHRTEILGDLKKLHETGLEIAAALAQPMRPHFRLTSAKRAGTT